MNKLDHALALAKQGFRIFPIAPNSKVPPKDFAWKREATRDAGSIRHWWNQEPNYNIGVACGEGTIVVDADTKGGKPGLASLGMLDMLELPQSFRVTTPSGGVHVYLKTGAKHRNRVDSIPGFEGLDIRTDGGYVLGPGSEIDGNLYGLADKNGAYAIAEAPAWFDDLLQRNAAKHTKKSDAPLVELDTPKSIELAVDYLKSRAPQAIEGQGGDETTFRVAAALRDYGVSQPTALELLLEHWNEQKASPPWMPDDLSLKVENAFQYGTGSWGGRTARAEFEELDIDEGVSPFADAPAPAPTVALMDVPAAKDEKPSKVLKTLGYAEMVAIPEPMWLADGILVRETSALVFGKSNAYKSFLAIDLGLHVSQAMAWHGRAVTQANVLFVATEGAIGVARKRIPGWYAHHDIPVEQRKNAWLCPQQISLDNKEHVDILIATMKHLKIGLLVLDIFGGTMDGTETEDTTARSWSNNTQRIIRECKSAILTVAHTGWQDDTRARMHTHFWGSFDTRLKVEGDKDKLISILSVERHKDADSRGEYGFRLVESHGTLVPVLDDTVAKSKYTGLSPACKKALAALEKAIADHGAVPDEAGCPVQRCAPLDIFRQYCIDAGISNGKESAQRQAFSRAMRELESKKLVFQHKGWVWSDEGQEKGEQ